MEKEGKNPGRCKSDPELRGKGLGLGWWQKECRVKDNTEKHFQRQKRGDGDWAGDAPGGRLARVPLAEVARRPGARRPSLLP